MPPDTTSGYSFLPQSWQAGASSLSASMPWNNPNFSTSDWLSGIGTLHIPFGGSSVVGQSKGSSTWLGSRGATLVIGLILIAGGVAGIVKNA